MRPALGQAAFVDIETPVAPGYSLTRMSTRMYIEDPRFQILGLAIAIGAGDPRFFWSGAERPADGLIAAYDLLQTQRDRGAILVAHNAHFDGSIVDHYMGLHFARVFDTVPYARFLGIGASLKNAAQHFGYEKLEPPPFTEASLRDPVQLQRMALYCMTDAALCREIFLRAIDDTTFPDVEFDVIEHTARLNLRGVRVGAPQIETLLDVLRTRRDAELERFTTTYLFDTSHINRTKRVSAFLQEHFGTFLPSLDRRDERFVAAIERGGAVADFLKSRARLQTLLKAIKRAVAYAAIPGGRVFGVLRTYGAHTGRFSAGGRDAEKLNLHGLGKGNDFLELPELALERTVVVPEEGCLFRAADLSTIEARVVAWLADEKELLTRFRSDEDVYSWFAGLVYHDTEIKKGGPNRHLRALGKTCVLGLGFGMGLFTFLSRVRAERISCSVTDAKKAFATYQSSFPRIKDLRRKLMAAFEKAVQGWSTETPLWRIRCAQSSGAGAPTVAIDLPTGRTLYYRSIRIDHEMTEYGPRPAVWFAPHFGGKGKAAPATKRKQRRKFSDGVVRHRLIPQVIVENVVQAIARDVMVHQALELERRGFPVAWHAHDEIVVMCHRCACTGPCRPQCGWTQAGVALLEVMGRVPDTLPRLAGLPVGCELNEKVRETYSD